MEVKKIQDNAGYAYYVAVNYDPIVNMYNIKLSSTYTNAKAPDEQRTVISFNLSDEALVLLIDEILECKAQTRKRRKHEKLQRLPQRTDNQRISGDSLLKPSQFR